MARSNIESGKIIRICQLVFSPSAFFTAIGLQKRSIYEGETPPSLNLAHQEIKTVLFCSFFHLGYSIS